MGNDNESLANRIESNVPHGQDEKISGIFERPIEDWAINVLIAQFLRILAYALVFIGMLVFLNCCIFKPAVKLFQIQHKGFSYIFSKHFTVYFLKLADKILISLTIVVSGYVLLVAYRKFASEQNKTISTAIKGIDIQILSMVIITLAVSFLTAALDNGGTGIYISFETGFGVGFVILCIAIYIYICHPHNKHEDNGTDSHQKIGTGVSNDSKYTSL